MRGVYLIHFSVPYKHARHYMGFSDDIESRIAAHRSGTGARLMQVVHDAGIAWIVVRLWEGAGRLDERRLKNRKNAPTLCPICNPRLSRPALAPRFRALPPREVARRYALGLPPR